MKAETLPGAGYSMIHKLPCGSFLLWDGRKLEVFQAHNSAPSGWHLKHGKKFLEFIRTATPCESAILEAEYSRDPVKACKKALRWTVDIDENQRLECINLLLGTHGTEGIRGEWQNGYWCDIVAVYCNAGDTYSTTVLQARGESRFDNSRFFVGNVGDFVERNEKRLGIV